MEGNRDEADRCIEIGIKALSEGKIEKAEKFFTKADNLYPTDKAKGESNRTFNLPSSLDPVPHFQKKFPFFINIYVYPSKTF